MERDFLHRSAEGQRKRVNLWRPISANRSVAVAVECGLNGRLHARVNRSGSTQVTTTFLRQTGRQVAGASVTVHCLTRSGQAKSLFGPLVGFHLGFGFSFSHFRIAVANDSKISGIPYRPKGLE
jgi:hypothetical protein